MPPKTVKKPAGGPVVSKAPTKTVAKKTVTPKTGAKPTAKETKPATKAGAKAATAATVPEASGEETEPGIKVNLKELDDVLIKDVGNKIKDSGKWPLLIEAGGERAATFLRYRDTNYLNAISPGDMEPDSIRRAVIGAIRYGKPVVVDMMEVDMFQLVSDRFNEVIPKLMDMIMDKSIMQEDNYMPLVNKDLDGAEYDQMRFNDQQTEKFNFIIITKNRYPPEALLDMTYPLRIVVPV